MAETLKVIGQPYVDDYGDFHIYGSTYEVPGCVVGLQGQASIDGGGVWDGDATTLEVLAPGGTLINEGDEVEFRGERYHVTHVPFDWSVGRVPACSVHRPRVRFLIERAEA